jgi:hypothetical protein
MTDMTAVKESGGAELDTPQKDAVGSEVENNPKDEKSRRLQVSITLRGSAITTGIIVLVAAVALLAWAYFGAEQTIETQNHRSENNAHAEKVALNYAVSAAEMNFQDLNGWKVKLVAGTSPALKDKLTKAATSMEQIIVPMQWTSTARPLVAKVRTETGGAYVVDAFVSVLTKTVQAPEGLQSTATYSVTIQSGQNWQISDVGGIGSVVEEK